jgi:type II secretion system protein H
MASRSGFTLIELAIVMLVLSILASAAAPRYIDAMANYRVDLAANRLAGDLRLLREHARRTSVNQTMSFVNATDRYTSTTMRSLDNPAANYLVSLRTSEYATEITAITFAGTSVTFNIYGRPTGAGDVTLRSGTRTRTVRVDANGHVSVL